MWILECEGDALGGKKLWLRPGKKFLFGRTQAEAGQFVVSDKTISRKHLTVEVASVQASDCANPRSRSRITLEDLSTKIGTLVNGEQIRGKKFVLDKDENTISLGKYKHHFRFTWVPVTFTFSFTTKEHKADPYTALYELLGPLDIKVLIDYDRQLTTHLVAKKRNTSKGLQALINGRYIVHNDTFIKALVVAATPAPEGPAPLEADFAAHFPNELEYLPPRGEEPTERGFEAYAPNNNRQDMFDGYTFVFYERRQFENLLAPITDGRGKAMLREAIPNDTTVEDFVRYVKGLAGEKGLGEFEDGSEGKGVVVVRFNPVKGVGTEWFAEFGRQVALHLDHRLIEQNEFLDAILGNDASVLRRPLDIEASGVVAPPPTAATAISTQTLRSSDAPAPTPAEMAPPEPPKRARTRRAGRAEFKGFAEDDFSGPIISSSVPESMGVDQPADVESQSQGLFVSQDPEMEVQREVSQPPEMNVRTSRKRHATPIFEEGDIMEDIAPAAAALKRRRLANDADRRRKGELTPPPPAPDVKEEPTSRGKGKKVKQEIDILEVARKQREKAEALAKAEREALQEQFEGMDIEKIRNLAIIEEIEVKRTQPPPRRSAQPDESERWEAKWNGRKNFKKFHRRVVEPGETGTASRARDLHRVIVPLEEVKKKDFGIGDEYWDAGDSQRKKKNKGKGKETQDVSQLESQARSKSRAADMAAQILASEAEDEFAEGGRANESASGSDLEIVEQPPKATTSRTSRSQKLTDKTSASQNLPTQSNKRAAATTLTKPAPTKKARQTTIRKPDSDDDDDSDDGLKFRFRKRT